MLGKFLDRARVVPNRLRGHFAAKAIPAARGALRALPSAALAIALIAVSGASEAADPYYVAVDLGVPDGGLNSTALAVNADATVVVGTARVGTKNLPFVWRNGQMQVIGNSDTMTAGTARSVTGTADNFRVVGEYTDAVNKFKHAFVYTSDGTFKDLPMLSGHEQSTAWSINADGKIAGYTYYSVDPSNAIASLRKQAVPVRWDPDPTGTAASYTPPVPLYNGPLLNYSVAQCQYSGRGFSMSNDIRLNDAQVPVVVTSWDVPTTNCFSQGTTINVVNYAAYRPIKHSTADTDIGLLSWKVPGQPGFGAYPGVYPNQDIREYANTYAVSVNNVGTELHNEDAPLFLPGLTSRRITGYTWKETAGVSTYTAAGGVLACNTTQTLRYADVNDSDEIVGYTNVGAGSPCVQTPKGFVRTLGSATYRYLLDRVNAACGWTRLVPSDINNAGHIVGGGLRSGAGGGHAFLLVPVDSQPADADACTNPATPDTPNKPPVANAGPDQVVEATSPQGATVLLDGSASSDPDDDPLTFAWSSSVAQATGVSPAVTLPIGTHVFTLTVTDDKAASAADTVTVTVRDTIPPDTKITSAPAPRTNVATPTFTFVGSDVATVPEDMKFECNLDGAGWSSCTTPKSYSGLTDGPHAIAVRAIDGAGLVDPTPASYAWTQDTTPPETTITSKPGAFSRSAAASFGFSGEDAQAATSALTFECQRDGGPWAPCTSPTAYSGLAEGAHAFAVRAADDLGNVDPTPASHAWFIDTVAPSITISAPADGQRYLIGAAGSTNYSCSDAGSGVARCDGPVASGTSIDTYTPGQFDFKVDAEDRAGNSSSRTNRYSVGYGVCNYQQFGARKAGSVVPIKLQACDGSGTNLSRGTLVTVAVGISKTSDNSSSPIADAGQANPDFNFRFDPTLFGGAGGYIFNLDTNGLTTGTYLLSFRIGSDPQLNTVQFEIR